MSQFGVQLHTRSNTKTSGNGKKNIKARGKRRSEKGGYFSATKLSDKRVITSTRERGGNEGVRLKHVAVANLLTKDGYKSAKISEIVESKDNRNFARQGIITKGTIINTDLGKAVVINRPGREGSINARLL
jgi:small subunit ribosomal protein S8e